jgi:hypothetical protein
MSLIHTCQLNGVNPHAYRLAIAKHPQQVKADPAAWVPWNYPRQRVPVDSS